MTCRLRWCVEMENRCRIPIWRTFVRMTCHPRATYHIAGCCHLMNSLSRFQSHCHIAGCSHLTKSMSRSCHIAGVRILSGIMKIFFRHIFFFLFLMQFRFWEAAAFVSSPIHWLMKKWKNFYHYVVNKDEYVPYHIMVSGVFRISVRRWRGTVGVDGCGVWWWWLGLLPKKNHFCLQNGKFGCILTQFLTGSKHK